MHQCNDKKKRFMEILRLICMGNHEHFHFYLKSLAWKPNLNDLYVGEFWNLHLELHPITGLKNLFSARNTAVPVVFVWSPFSTYGSPLHHGASLGYRGWGNGSLSRWGEESTGNRGGTFSAASFSALESVGPGLERPPGSISRTSPARSLAWPTAAPCTLLGDCTKFLWNITAFNGMWLVTLLLLYSLQEGRLELCLFKCCSSACCPLTSAMLKLSVHVCYVVRVMNCAGLNELTSKTNDSNSKIAVRGRIVTFFMFGEDAFLSSHDFWKRTWWLIHRTSSLWLSDDIIKMIKKKIGSIGE